MQTKENGHKSNALGWLEQCSLEGNSGRWVDSWLCASSSIGFRAVYRDLAGSDVRLRKENLILELSVS